MSGLTNRQELFVQEYFVDLNAAQAAIRVGYNPKYAYNAAHKNMKNPLIQARIKELMDERCKRTVIDRDRVIRELARIAFANAADLIDMKTASINPGALRDDTAAIVFTKVRTIPTAEGEITEWEIRLADKLKALELLGKHLGMFSDKGGLPGNAGVLIVNDIPKDAK
jgi:phage terminase small subunit